MIGLLQRVREASVADYTFDKFKSKKNEFDKIDGLHIFPLAKETEESLESMLGSVRLLRTSVQLARDLANRPGNDLTPDGMALAAKEMADGLNGLRVTILGKKELLKEKMGGILAVSQGSIEEPRMIVLEHRPKKPKRSVVLIGKGVTFDSGGISLKPGAGMDLMKSDMGGAAAVMGAALIVARLKLPVDLTVLVPAAENMPDGGAVKPADVITMASGKTVEVLNTDAEGRLILCDALTYTERFEPAAVVDIATLTGACIVALGDQASGLMANDQKLADELRLIPAHSAPVPGSVSP